MKEWGVMVDGDYETPKWEDDMEDEGIEVCISTRAGDGGCGWYGLDKILILDCADKHDYKKAIKLARHMVSVLNDYRECD